MGSIKLLDCTLRDGGLGLEDAFKNEIADLGFDAKKIDNIIRELSHSSIDIVELGSIEITNDDRRRYAIYPSVEQLSLTIPKTRSPEQMYVGLFRGPDTPMDEIPQWNPMLVDGLRVIIRYSELKKSLDFCAGLARKGYKVFVQPMLTMRYSLDELQLIINSANEMGAYALYFVDSYGYMEEKDIDYFSAIYDRLLSDEIRMGFHAHNNMNLAFSNAKHFINYFSTTRREVIVDSCVEGMGQGAGNLQTELLVSYLNELYGEKYNLDCILQICEEVEEFLNDEVWGYSPIRLLPAIYKTAYKYAICFRKKYGLNYREINKLLKLMPDDLRHRFTENDAEKIIKEYICF